jgi:hypothetical protein
MLSNKFNGFCSYILGDKSTSYLMEGKFICKYLINIIENEQALDKAVFKCRFCKIIN